MTIFLNKALIFSLVAALFAVGGCDLKTSSSSSGSGDSGSSSYDDGTGGGSADPFKSELDELEKKESIEALGEFLNKVKGEERKRAQAFLKIFNFDGKTFNQIFTTAPNWKEIFEPLKLALGDDEFKATISADLLNDMIRNFDKKTTNVEKINYLLSLGLKVYRAIFENHDTRALEAALGENNELTKQKAVYLKNVSEAKTKAEALEAARKLQEEQRKEEEKKVNEEVRKKKLEEIAAIIDDETKLASKINDMFFLNQEFKSLYQSLSNDAKTKFRLMFIEKLVQRIEKSNIQPIENFWWDEFKPKELMKLFTNKERTYLFMANEFLKKSKASINDEAKWNTLFEPILLEHFATIPPLDKIEEGMFFKPVNFLTDIVTPDTVIDFFNKKDEINIIGGRSTYKTDMINAGIADTFEVLPKLTALFKKSMNFCNKIEIEVDKINCKKHVINYFSDDSVQQKLFSYVFDEDDLKKAVSLIDPASKHAALINYLRVANIIGDHKLLNTAIEKFGVSKALLEDFQNNDTAKAQSFKDYFYDTMIEHINYDKNWVGHIVVIANALEPLLDKKDFSVKYFNDFLTNLSDKSDLTRLRSVARVSGFENESNATKKFNSLSNALAKKYNDGLNKMQKLLAKFNNQPAMASYLFDDLTDEELSKLLKLKP